MTVFGMIYDWCGLVKAVADAESISIDAAIDGLCEVQYGFEEGAMDEEYSVELTNEDFEFVGSIVWMKATQGGTRV